MARACAPLRGEAAVRAPGPALRRRIRARCACRRCARRRDRGGCRPPGEGFGAKPGARCGGPRPNALGRPAARCRAARRERDSLPADSGAFARRDAGVLSRFAADHPNVAFTLPSGAIVGRIDRGAVVQRRASVPPRGRSGRSSPACSRATRSWPLCKTPRTGSAFVRRRRHSHLADGRRPRPAPSRPQSRSRPRGRARSASLPPFRDSRGYMVATAGGVARRDRHRASDRRRARPPHGPLRRRTQPRHRRRDARRDARPSGAPARCAESRDRGDRCHGRLDPHQTTSRA